MLAEYKIILSIKWHCHYRISVAKEARANIKVRVVSVTVSRDALQSFSEFSNIC